MLYFRMLFMMLVSLYTSRVILAALGIEDFGIYNVVGGVITMFGFFNGAMSSFYSTFILHLTFRKRSILINLQKSFSD